MMKIINKKIKQLLFFVSINVAFIDVVFPLLDPTFGIGGTVTTSIGLTNFIASVTAQDDTSIAVAGVITNNAATKLAIARYLTAGILDATFNPIAGFRTTLIGSRTEGNSLDIQADGKYVVAGFAYENKTNFAVMRYTTTGALDTTFNGVGFVTTQIGTGASAQSVKIQGDQKIVVGGTAVNGPPQFACLRYTTTGGLDGTFGTGGKVLTQIGIQASIKQIAIQPDQKIVAVGYASDGSIIRMALVRYEANGTLDSTFGSSGIVVTEVNMFSRANAVAIQTDGSIVVAGFTRDSGVNKFVVARYTPTGILDQTFNGTGIIVTPIQDGAEANAIAIQSDGKIVVGGYSIGDVAIQFAVARYSPLGVLDPLFGTNGIELTTIGGSGSESVVNALTIQIDGRIVAAGYSNAAGTTLFNFALARYAL